MVCTVIKLPSSVFLLSLALLLVRVHAGEASAEGRLVRTFEDNKINGTFAWLDRTTGSISAVNNPRANERMIPASTFKIANSLIALGTGVVASVDEIIPFDGTPQRFKAWERDHSMRTGIRVSSVPTYQYLARKIGLERYRRWLEKLKYGNTDPGKSVDTFWLNGPLRISAVEQVGFLQRLADSRLDVPKEHQEAVRLIIRLEQSGDRILYGKTGWTNATNPELGWFVGWVETPEATYPFALNIDIKTHNDAKKRIPLAKALLKEIGLYPADD